MTSEIPVAGLVERNVQNFARKPGAWAGQPKANVDWDSENEPIPLDWSES
jgi:hypothetical protein